MKVTQLCLTLWGPQGLYSPWNSPDQNTRVGIPSPGGLPNLGVEPMPLALREILYQLSNKGS